MRRHSFIVILAALAGCAKSEYQAASDTTAMGAAVGATISLADVAGTWNMRNMPEVGDSTLVQYQVMATAEPTGWMLHLPNRPPLGLQVTVEGDAITTEVGSFESVLRPGVQVTLTRTVLRMQDGKLVGTFEAHYSTTGADSVLRGRVEGTRTP
jgi:hypothetical protein